jgi:hypothetical protein
MKKLSLLVITVLCLCLTSLAQTGPGGVGNKDGAGSQPVNVLWLKADVGVTSSGGLVNSWLDQSGNFNNATGVSATRPTFSATDVNFNNLPSISFPNTAASNFFLEVPDNDNLDNTSTLTVFIVVRPTSATGASLGILSKRTSASVDQSYVFSVTNAYRYQATVGTTGPNNIASSNSTVNSQDIVSATISGTAIVGQRDGAAQQTATGPSSIANNNSKLFIGSFDNLGNNNFEGQIAEVIIYRTVLNASQRQIVTNYLSSKYNAPVTVDLYAGDNTPGSDFDRDVFGIGQQSGTLHSEAESSGLAFSPANGTLNADGEFLLAGHKAITNSVVSSADAGANLAVGVQQRWNRTWYIDKSGSLDAFISFDFSDGIANLFPQNKNNYVLLKFNSGTSLYEPVANITSASKSIVGDRVVFEVSNADLVDGIYTLGTTNSTASPVGGVNVRTWYSYQSGTWNTANSWTLDGGVTPLLVNPSNQVPSSTDNVVITSGRTITATTNSLTVNSIEVNGVLDLGITTSHNFTTIGGNGRIRIAGTNENFPSGDATNFASNSIGGTVEIYGSGMNLNQSRTFNNLTVNMDAASGPVSLLNNIILNGTFTVENGTFQFGDNTANARNLTVFKDVTIKSTGVIQVGTGGLRHQFNLYNDFTNDGGNVAFTNRAVVDYTTEATNGIVDVNFLNDAEDQEVQLNGPSKFYRIEIDKGVDDTYKVTFSASASANFTLFGFANEDHGSSAQINTMANAFALIMGTAEIGDNIIIPVLSGLAGNYNINQGAQLWVNGGSVSKDLGNSLVPYGKVRVTQGVLSANVQSGITTRDNGTIIVEGGTLTTRQIRTSVNGAANVGGYVQSGGDVTVNGGTINADYGCFSLTYPGNVFSMSGGTLTIKGANTGNGGNGNNRGSVFINSDPANVSVTGGTVYLEISNNNIFRVTSRVPFWNLTLRKTAGTATTVELLGTESGDNNVAGTEVALAIQPLIVLNDMLIQNNVTFQTNSANVTIGGDFEIQNGSTYNPGTNTTTFNGSGVASLTFGNTTTSQVWPNITINKTTTTDEVVIQGGAVPALRTTGELRIERGNLDYSSFIASAQGSVYLADTVGKSSGSGSLSLDGSSAQVITSASGAVHNLTINNATGVSLSGDIAVFKTLGLTNGVFNIATSKLSLVGSAATISGSGFGTSKMIQTSGNASDGGIEMYFNANESFVFPIGTNANASVRYTPATATIQGFVDDGYIQVNPVDDILQTTNLSATPAADILSYYWRIRPRSFSTQPAVSYQFVYADGDIGGVESNYVPGNVLGLTPFTRSAETLSAIDIAGNTLTFNGLTATGAFPGAGFTLETANYTAGATGRFTGTPRVLYTKRFSGDGWNIDWRNGTYWTFGTNGAFDKHDSRQADANDYPKAGDIAVIGYVPFTDTNTPVADRGKPHGIALNRVETVAELRFTQMLTAGGLPTARIYASNFQYRPTLVINNGGGANIGQLGDGIVSGEGAFWIRSTGANLSDPNFSSVDLGAFVEEDSAYFIYESTLAAATYLNMPSVMPNVLMATDNWGAEDKSSTITNDITITNDLEILGDMNLILNTGATGNITVLKNLRFFRSNAKGNDSGGGGELQFGNTGTARTVTVYGDLELGNGYAGRIYVSGANAGPTVHTFNLYGNFYQRTIAGNGFVGGNNAANDRINMNLLGASSVVINNSSGDAPQFYSLTVNKGSSIGTIATFNASFTLGGPTNIATKALTLVNGLMIINNIDTDINLATGGGDFNIPAAAGLEVKAGTVRVSGANTGITLDGLLRISGGAVNMDGGASVNNYIEYSASGNATLEVSAGTLTVGSQVRRNLTSTTGILKYNQTGGTVVVAKNAAPTTSRGVFEVLNTGSEFRHSGGSFTVVQGINSTTVPSLWLEAGTSTVTSASTITIGNASTPAGATNIGIQSTVPLHNLTIAGSNTPTSKIYISPLALNGNLTISTGTTFNALGQGLSIGGTMLVDGIFTPTGNTTTFTGTGGISGASVTLDFYNLSKTGSGTITLARNITINNDFELLGGIFAGQAFTTTLKGNAKVDGTFTNTSGTGLVFSGTSTQLLQRTNAGTGTLGIVTIDNNSGVRVPDVAGYTFVINNGLRMVKGVFDISGSLLTLGQNALITPVNVFSVTNMIQTNSSFTDNGVKKIFPAGFTTDFTFPVGQLYYTPIKFNFSSTGYTTGTGTPSILVRPANEKHSSVIEDSEAPDTEIVDANNVLQYHFIINADNVTSSFRSDMTLYYVQSSVSVTSPYAEADYIAARILSDANPTNAIEKFTSTEVDENQNTIGFSFSGVTDAGISGEYFAGIDDAIVDNVRTYTTVRTGNVNEGSLGGVYDVSVPGGGNIPNAAIIVVEAGHTLTFNVNNVSLYRTEIKAGGILKIPTASIGHRLGTLIGEGTLLIESNTSSAVMPAAYYNDFFTCTGGSLTYDGSGNYDVMGGISTIRNLTINGTNTKTLANNDIYVCEDFTVNGPVFSNTTNDRSVTIGDDLIISNTGQFRTGNGTIVINDDIQQSGGIFLGEATNATIASDISISGGNFISGNNGIIRVGGNLTVAPTATFHGSKTDGTGTLLYRFNGALPQIITGDFAGTSSKFQQLEIANPSGLSLAGNVDVDQLLLLSTGNIFPGLNQFRLLLAASASPTIGKASSFVSGKLYKVLNAGGGFYFPIGKGTWWRPASLSAPSSARTWNIEYFDAIATQEAVVDNITPTPTVPAIVRLSTTEYWKVSDDASPTTALIGLSWGIESDVSAVKAQREALKVMVWNDVMSSWDSQGGGTFSSGHTQSQGIFTATTASSFSERVFTLGSTEAANALPVTFLTFTGRTIAGRSILSWETALENNNQYFAIEHSIDGETFNEIGKIDGGGTTHEQSIYSFTHNAPSIGRNYYRLRQIDFDGKTAYHPEIVALLVEEESLNFDFDLYPNPLKNQDLNIVVLKSNSRPVQVKIYSLAGKLIYKDTFESQQAVDEIKLALERSVRSGLYIVEVTQGPVRKIKRLVIH